MKKILPPVLFITWLASILTAFYIVQKPDFLTILPGLKHLILVMAIPLGMAALSACMGAPLFKDSGAAARLIFGSAIGMGIFGMAGFSLAVFGLATQPILLALLAALAAYFLATGKFKQAFRDLKLTAAEISASAKQAADWVPGATLLAAALGLLMSLAPPIEDFDALLYHLAVPERWLNDGGLISSPALTYWYPHLVEGSFVLPMAFGFDTSTHLIHFFWLALTVGIVWLWARQEWDDSTAWNAIAILLTMPSLLWLASWAYTDYALTFTGIAAMYALWQWKRLEDKKWLSTAGVMAGMAMSIKYTSFFIPLVGVLLILLWERRNAPRLKISAQFATIAVLVAAPWYIRNWVWTSNPVYPFVFPGRHWDSFLAQRFSAAGTGIGFDLSALLALPLTATLGIHDTNYFDGRFGPIYLILLPIAIWALWKSPQEKDTQKQALLAIEIFSLAGITVWTLGVINSANLFQARYLFPALIPAAIPLALGLNALTVLDLPKLKVSFIFRVFLFLTILINLFDFSLQTLARNPLGAALGIISRPRYVEMRQPGYASALALIETLPAASKVYFLFEPRSYGMKAYSEPDIINIHFQHDLWMYQTPEKVVESWEREGYTHVLFSNQGAEFIRDNAPSADYWDDLQATLNMLTLSVPEVNGYQLYQLP